MATHRLSIFGAATLPDTSGNVWFEPAALVQTNDRYPQLVARFKDTATKDSLGTRFSVPNNFVSAPVVEIVWSTTAIAGNAIWTLDYNCGAKTITLDPSTDEENLTVTTAAPAGSLLGMVSRMALTAANITAADVFQGKIARNGAGADTIAADLLVFDIIFEYSDV